MAGRGGLTSPPTLHYTVASSPFRRIRIRAAELARLEMQSKLLQFSSRILQTGIIFAEIRPDLRQVSNIRKTTGSSSYQAFII